MKQPMKPNLRNGYRKADLKASAVESPDASFNAAYQAAFDLFEGKSEKIATFAEELARSTELARKANRGNN